MKAYLIFLILIFCKEITNAQPFPSESTLINLYDAFWKEKEGLTQDWGFSCILNYQGKIILFDGGSNAAVFGPHQLTGQ